MLNCSALKSQHLVNQLREKGADQLSRIPETPAELDISSTWSTLHTALHPVGVESIGYTRKRHQDWFNNSAPGIYNLLQAKHKALAAHLSNPQSTVLKVHLNSLRSETQHTLRAMENDWWTNKASKIQHYAYTNTSHAFYDAIKSIYGPQRKNITPDRSADAPPSSRTNSRSWTDGLSTLRVC